MMIDDCHCLATVIGWLLIFYIIIRLLISINNVLYPFFLAQPADLRIAAGANWAIVTGGTDGIGKCYAEELAHKGFSLLLVSRNQLRLDSVKAEIELKTGVKVKTIAFDFSTPNLDDYEQKLLPEIRQLDIGVLVNNVGAVPDYPDFYHKMDGGMEFLNMITKINIMPATILMSAVLPQMIERNSGIIVNISSASSYYKMQLFSVYSASKKYLSWLTRILQNEYAKTNITIQLVNPMVVATKLAKVRRASLVTPTADTYAKYAVRTIGLVNETTGYYMHQIRAEFFKWVPEYFINWYLFKRMKRFHDVIVARKLRQAQNDIKMSNLLR